MGECYRKREYECSIGGCVHRKKNRCNSASYTIFILRLPFRKECITQFGNIDEQLQMHEKLSFLGYAKEHTKDGRPH